jgi:hypothetical protein
VIGKMDGITGEPCYICGDPLTDWALQEISEGNWVIVCTQCDLDLMEGK